jgi:hypothetical protein
VECKRGVFFLFWGGKLNKKKITDIKYNQGLRWPPFDFFHVTTNQKHAGVMEGGWDRPHDRARTLGERDGNDEGNEDDDDKYGKDMTSPMMMTNTPAAAKRQKNTQQPTKNMRARWGRDEI